MRSRTTRGRLAIAALALGAAGVPLAANATTTPPDTTAAAAAGTDAPGTTGAAASGGGGELIDGSTFPQGAPDHIDPALNSTLDSYQVIRAMYDGLTDVDASDPEALVVVPHQAESYEPNEDASVWTFQIKDGLTFADGEPILPSTYVASWNRAASLGGDYSYLFNFIEGGAAVLDGSATELTGVVADDEAMTLTVTLSAPYSNFDAVAGFQLFRPVPAAAVEAGDDYENQLMVGSGAFTMESERNDQEIVLVKNDAWAGDINGDTWDTRPDRIVFLISTDVDTSFAAMEAGEVMSATVPSGRSQEALDNWGNSVDTTQLASYHYIFDSRDAIVAGPENVQLRQAISLAIDRDRINETVFNGARVTSTGIVPPGIPGYKADICDYCTYDPEAAQAAFDAWSEAGGTLSEPIPIQYNEGGVHGDVTALMIEDLAAIGIDAVADPQPSDTYFSEFLGENEGCVFCRVGWTADYPTYDNFTYDIFSGDALNGNNYGYVSEEFDQLIADAKGETDETTRNELFNQAEELLLNTDVMAVPINWFVGDLAWDETKVSGFDQDVMGLVHFEEVVVL